MTPQDEDDRPVEIEIEVPGTPEQVWEAIATGPGMSAWFVPTEIEPREGGTIAQYHGPGAGMDQTGRITGYDAPRRLAWETPGWAPDDGVEPATMAVEFLVEARAGGTCVVRVVNGGFGSGEEWDQARESTRAGWPSVLENLRIFLTHFAGQAPSSIVVGAELTGRPREQAWPLLLDALGMKDAEPGERVSADAAAPEFAGVVERSLGGQMIVRLDAPAAGLGFVGAGGPGQHPFVFLRAQLFGPGSAEVAEREEPRWRSWIEERFGAQSS